MGVERRRYAQVSLLTSIEDQEPQFPNLKQEHCYLTLEGYKAALAGWVPVGARRGAKMAESLSVPCPP